jgi:uncharacterized protein involved in type VI secretion and phage assembly
MSFPDPSTGTPDEGIRGVGVGIVTDNADPEALGRVKLRFPWRDAADESYWARIATTMAGDDRGTYFLPEVGDEVLVAFEDGDIHHPYVLGALWNGEERPPAENADGNNDLRKIRSRSGHEVVLDDASDGAVVVRTSGGHEVVLDDASDGGVSLTTSGGHSVVLDDSAGDASVRVEDSSGRNSVVFDATRGSVDVTAGTKVSVSAPSLELRGDGSVTVEATGVLRLSGSIVKIN